MGDRLTLLRALSPLIMAKRWRADGSIEPYSKAKQFFIRQVEVNDIHGLSALLRRCEGLRDTCLIRGTPKPEVDLRAPQRRLRETYDDIPLHTVLVEVDTYKPLIADPLKEPEEAAREYIADCLPDVFRGASFHWQLSNSAGAPGREDLLKCHLWFWLDTPFDSSTLKAWAKSLNLQLDHSVFQTVQVHYTAAPVFDDGAADPVPVRSGFWQGARDSVPLVIDTDALSISVRGARKRGDRIDVEDALADHLEASWEVWGTLPDGGMIVSCPWEDNHSGGAKGDTSSVYFPAGTNGHADGAYVCLHNSCDGKGRTEFAEAVGYSEARFACLAAEETAPERELGDRHRALNDPLVLPPYLRDGAGKVLTTIGNVKLSLYRPDISGYELRYDLFKDGVVCSEPGTDNWRPFTDADYTELRVTLEKRGLLHIGREMIRDAVHAVAQENSFDTAQDWLNRLVWDGVPRIETFWIDHFGVEDDEAGYSRAVGLYTWTALAGRVLEPGVQADMVPILVGRQGLRKSRGVEAMAPSKSFYTKMGFNENEVERARKMRGKVIIELDELKGLKSRDAEEILSWVTRSEEHWTPKFMEMTTTFRRRFLPIATTNEDDILDNPHGERRWLPLKAGSREGFDQVDTDGIAEVRDQLWAEGAALFAKSGIQWEKAERLARNEHSQYKADDIWSHAVRRWLDTPDMGGLTPRQRSHVTVIEVAEGALSLPARAVKYADQRRISKILRVEGFDNVTRRVDERNVKVWAPKVCVEDLV